MSDHHPRIAAGSFVKVGRKWGRVGYLRDQGRLAVVKRVNADGSPWSRMVKDVEQFEVIVAQTDELRPAVLNLTYNELELA